MDREYWHVPGARSWHALNDVVLKPVPPPTEVRMFTSICSRFAQDGRNQRIDRADRLPPTAHLCGNCSRIIAARTDIEPDRRRHTHPDDVSCADAGAAGHPPHFRTEDVPEPTATEQDDWSPV